MPWLQPYADSLLTGVPERSPGPDARYETREAVELAFITALQRMPPRQAAVLILRDVLGYPAPEVAEMLATTETAVKGALQRARATAPARDRPFPRPPAGRALPVMTAGRGRCGPARCR